MNFNPKNFNPKSINKLLIRSTNWVGDAIISTPAVRAIRKNFPNAKISILAKPWVAPVFQESPYIDEIIFYDANGRHSGNLGKIRLAKDLRRYNFDAAILLQNAFEAALITFLAGIPRRIGFTTDGRGMLLNSGVRLDPELKKIHQVHYYLGILKGAGLSANGTDIDLFISEAERKQAAQMLEKSGINRGDKILGIGPGAEYGTAKRWFPERFANLCDMADKESGLKTLIFGGPGQEDIGMEISRLMNGEPVDLCGKTSLRQAIALVEQCSVFVTNDSGLMHVAAALKKPLVAVFGSTDHITTAPWGETGTMVRVGADCSPCLLTDCPTDHRCMKSVSVEMVFEAVKKKLYS